jgi:hypothetical protein
MNDFELETRLKAVPLPERPADYWEHFPAQVRTNLRRAVLKPVAENLWLPRLAWAGGLATLLILTFVFAQIKPVQTVSVALFKNEKHFRTEFVQFENQLHVLMRDEHGLHYLIAENE